MIRNAVQHSENGCNSLSLELEIRCSSPTKLRRKIRRATYVYETTLYFSALGKV